MHDNEGDELYDDDELWENIGIFEVKINKKAKTYFRNLDIAYHTIKHCYDILST